MNQYDGFAVDVTDRIIACAIEVHRHLGPGLFESVYESALCLELAMAGLTFVRQRGVPVLYKGELIAEHRPDLVVSDGDSGDQKRRAIQSGFCCADADVSANHRIASGIDLEFQPRSAARWNQTGKSLTLCLCGSVARHR